MKLIGKTDTGRCREQNEDWYFISPGGELAIVADGMGGLEAGEVASRKAVEQLKRNILDLFPTEIEMDWDLSQSPTFRMDVLQEVFQHFVDQINEELILEGVRRGSRVGTTMVLVLAHAGKLFYANVGDSRIYMLRQRKLQQISRDHSWINYQKELGPLNPEEVRRHQHVVTRALGVYPHVQPDCGYERLQKEDLFLLCTDGLTDMLDDSEIETILLKASERGDLAGGADYLVELANFRGGRDNITIVVGAVDSKARN